MELTKTQRRKRISTMLFGAFAIFFTGYPHIWSVYQPYVMEMAGWSQVEASFCFYLALGTFVFGNIVGGRIQDRYNPKIVILIGGGIFTVGILASAFLIVPSPLPLYFTYGLMQGFGQGMIYITIISTVQKWFPDKTGFASGVVVTANGLCGFFLAPASKTLLEIGGPKLAFLIIGAGIAMSWVLCSIFFYQPEISDTASVKIDHSVTRQYTTGEMVRTRKFYLLLATMLFGLISYFLISPVSQTHQIALGISSEIAVASVMAGSIVNASARLALPSISDKIGRFSCIKGVLIVCVVAMGIMGFSKSGLVTAAVVLIYGCYGGIMGTFPSFTSSIFGMKHAGENYGYVMIGIVIATIGAPIISEAVTLWRGSIQQVFIIGMVFAGIAFLCLLFLQKELRKNNECT